MAEIQFNVNMDLVDKYVPAEDITIPQEDNLSVKFTYSIFNREVAEDLTGATDIVVSFVKPDGHIVLQSNGTLELPNKVNIVANAQAFTYVGKVYMQVQYKKGTTTFNTRQAFFWVEKSGTSCTTVASSDYAPYLDNIKETWTLLSAVDLQALIDSKQTAENAQADVDALTPRVTTLETNYTDIASRVTAVESINTAQNTRLTNLESGQTTQDNRLTAIETKNTTQDTRLTALETTAGDVPTMKTDITAIKGVNTAQDSRLSALETAKTANDSKNATQDTNIGNNTSAISALQTSQATQDTKIANLESSQGADNTRMTAIETKNTQQDNRLTAIETVNTTQDTDITNIKTKNTAQDTRLTALEEGASALSATVAANKTAQDTVNTSTAGSINTLNTKMTAVETKNTQQDARLDAIETKNTTQDTRLATLEGANSVIVSDINALESTSGAHELRLDENDTKNASQDSLIASNSSAISSLTTTVNSNQTGMNTRVTALETAKTANDTKNTAQDNRLTALENYDVTQDTRMTAIEGVNTNQNANINTMSNDISVLNTKVNSFTAGAKGVYPTLGDLQLAKPAGDSGIYVVSSNGNWYYWSGSSWVSGGVYQAVSLSDNSVTSPKRTALGELAAMLPKSPSNSTINIDFNTKTVTVPPMFILYRGLRIDGGTTKNITYDTNNGAILVLSYNISANFYYVRSYYSSTVSYSGEQDVNICAFTHGTNYVYAIGKNYTINGQEVDNLKNKIEKYYVSPSGSDSNTGTSKASPFKTFNKAISSGASLILAESGDYWGQTIVASDKDELKIVLSDTDKTYSSASPSRPSINLKNGNGLSLTLDSGTGLYKSPFVCTPGDRFDRVFIAKSLPPIDIGERTNGVNACVWETSATYENDIKLTPVLTLSECQSTVGSFFYDGANIFINPSDGTVTGKIYRRPISEGSLIQLSNIKNLILEDVLATHGYEDIAVIKDCNNMKFRNCEFSYSALGNGIQPRNSNGNFYKCKSRKNRNDGFNIQIYGDTHFFDCEGMYNGDDGISHHDGCTGSITGGEYCYNGKGGVSPAHGCDIDLYDIISHHNDFGFYIVSTGDRPKGKIVRHIGCVSYNNIQRGIYVNGYKVLSYNCKHTNNTTPTEVISNPDSLLTIL